MTHYSLLDGLSKPAQIAARCSKIGATACALTDHGSISGAVQFYSHMKKAGIKPILGCEIYVCDQDAKIKSKENNKLSHFLLLAKNYNGWKTLIKIISTSNNSDIFYHKPRLDFNTLSTLLDGNIIGFCGHLGSSLANLLHKADNPIHVGCEFVSKMKDIFGNDNFFLESQLIDQENNPDQIGLTNLIRSIGKQTNTKLIATPDAHYCESEDAVDQRVLICNNLKLTLPEVNRKILNDESAPMGCFFKSDKYHIPNFEEMANIHTSEELENTNFVQSICEEYDITSRPVLPIFDCPEGYTPDEYLRQLCRNGWRDKIQNKVTKDDEKIYVDRIKHELEVLQGAGLSSYFLIVQDIVNYVKNNHWLAGPGRGCFLPDTRVKLADNTYKPICFINKGDTVIDAYGNCQEVIDTLEYDIEEEIIELEIGNKIIRCTKDHKFLTNNRGWVEAENLTEEDDIVEV